MAVFFSHCTQIRAVNSRFEEQLRALLAKGAGKGEGDTVVQDLAPLFLQYCPHFQIFAQYAEHHEAGTPFLPLDPVECMLLTYSFVLCFVSLSLFFALRSLHTLDSNSGFACLLTVRTPSASTFILNRANRNQHGSTGALQRRANVPFEVGPVCR